MKEQEINEFMNELNKIEYWAMAGVDHILHDSFVNVEYKYFEGYNVPIRTDKDGTPLESFNVSYERMTKFIDNRLFHSQKQTQG